MKQYLYSNEWTSAKNQSSEINHKAQKEVVFLIISLKTVFKNVNLVKSYNKPNPHCFVFSL